MANTKLKETAESRDDKTMTSQIEEKLCEYIRTQTRYLPGSRLPPLRELAEEFGVCHTTVDGALRNLELKGWLERRPKRAARVAKELPHRVIAFVSDEESRPWNPSVAESLMIAGINSELQKHNYGLRLFGLQEPAVDRTRIVRPYISEAISLAQKKLLSGIIMRGNPEAAIDYGKQINKLTKVPVLPFLRLDGDPIAKETYVIPDVIGAVRKMTEYLLEQGCRKVALFTCAAEAVQTRQAKKVSVFAATLARVGCRFEPKHVLNFVIKDNFESQLGCGAFETLSHRFFCNFWSQCRAAQKYPDGLIITDDIAAQAAAFGLLANQVRVPDDLKVIALSNKDSGVFIPLPFARCENDLFGMGEKAGRLILDQIAGEVLEQQEILVELKILPPLELEDKVYNNVLLSSEMQTVKKGDGSMATGLFLCDPILSHCLETTYKHKPPL
jgi:DNA-binding LacI/PurR family transcriptional regulator